MSLRGGASGHRRCRWPRARVERLVDDAVLRAGGQDLQRLEELDQAVLVVLRQRLKRAARSEGLARVGEHGAAERREETVVKEWRLVRGAPEALRQKPAVAVLES